MAARVASLDREASAILADAVEDVSKEPLHVSTVEASGETDAASQEPTGLANDDLAANRGVAPRAETRKRRSSPRNQGRNSNTKIKK